MRKKVRLLLATPLIAASALIPSAGKADAGLTDCHSWYSNGRAKATCESLGSGAAGSVRAILVGKRNGVAVLCGTGPWVGILQTSTTTTGCGWGTTPWFTSYQLS
jgi:hypothetical protein